MGWLVARGGARLAIGAWWGFPHEKMGCGKVFGKKVLILEKIMVILNAGRNKINIKHKNLLKVH